jgi:hypothetical protein
MHACRRCMRGVARSVHQFVTSGEKKKPHTSSALLLGLARTVPRLGGVVHAKDTRPTPTRDGVPPPRPRAERGRSRAPRPSCAPCRRDRNDPGRHMAGPRVGGDSRAVVVGRWRWVALAFPPSCCLTADPAATARSGPVKIAAAGPSASGGALPRAT